MKTKKVKETWYQSDKNWYQLSAQGIKSVLNNGVYTLERDRTGTHLKEMTDTFEFKHKIYDLDKEFIDRVMKTWNVTTNNLGLLLTGIQGSGKTVTAQCICNELKLPVIVITKSFDEGDGETFPVEFLANIKQDCIIFVDEYEKIFGHSTTLITLMDGVLSKNGGRKMFLFTSNSLYVNEFLLIRPSRIRYIKEYNGLSKEGVEEVVTDLLTDTLRISEVVSFILLNLPLVTIDVVKTFIHEVNIHGGPLDKIMQYLNVEDITPVDYNVFEKVGNNWNLVLSGVSIPRTKFASHDFNRSDVYINGKRFGTLSKSYVDGSLDIKIYATEEDLDNDTSNFVIKKFKFEPAVKTYHSLAF